MGGIYVRMFQMRYPEDVVGIMLLDPTHELRLFTTIEGKVVPIASVTTQQYRTALPQGEVTIPRRQVQTGEPFRCRRRSGSGRRGRARDAGRVVSGAQQSATFTGQF